MAYKQTDWLDHVTEYENRYREVQNSDGTITHEKVEGEVIQQGTPMSATNFNHMEEGIGEAVGMADLLYSAILVLLGHSEYTLDGLVDAINDGSFVAKKATVLETARSIALSGGATAAGVNFDGSGNITINVTALDPTKLNAAVAIAKGGTGATDAAAARTNLAVPSITDLQMAVIFADAQHSVTQAAERDHEERLLTIEAQLAALVS